MENMKNLTVTELVNFFDAMATIKCERVHIEGWYDETASLLMRSEGKNVKLYGIEDGDLSVRKSDSDKTYLASIPISKVSNIRIRKDDETRYQIFYKVSGISFRMVLTFKESFEDAFSEVESCFSDD